MNIFEDNFNDFPCADVLSLPTYNCSSKQMSFSFRYEKKSEDIFAYASLRPNHLEEYYGCQILDFGLQNSLFNERLFNSIEMTAQVWCDDDNKQFNALYFLVSDIPQNKAKIIIENINGFEFDEKYEAYIKKITHNKNAPD